MQLEDGEMSKMLIQTEHTHTSASFVRLPTEVLLTAPAMVDETSVQVKYTYGTKGAADDDEFIANEVDLSQPLGESLDAGASLGHEYICVMMPFKASRKATVQFDFQVPGNSRSTFKLRVDNSTWVDVELEGDGEDSSSWLRTPYEWPIEAGEHKLCVSGCDIGAELARVRGTNGVCMMRKFYKPAT